LDREPVALLQAQNWKLELLQRKERAAAGPASVYTNVHKLGGTLSKLANWVPKASLINGAIDASGGLTNTTASALTKTKSMLQVQLASVTWLKGILSAEVKLPNLQQTGTLQANVAGLPSEIKFRSDSLHL